MRRIRMSPRENANELDPETGSISHATPHSQLSQKGCVYLPCFTVMAREACPECASLTSRCLSRSGLIHGIPFPRE